MLSRRAFTIIEIMVVIIILGVITGLAVPRLGTVMQRIRNREAVQALLAIYPLQIAYRRDNGAYALDVNSLDIPGFNVFKGFKSLTLGNLSAACGGPAVATVARLTQNDDLYIMHVSDQAEILCTPCGGICQKMGYGNF